MAQLVFLATARREIAEIAAHLERETASRAVADSFVDKLVSHCERLAHLPGQLGRARSELGPNYRSTVFGKYVLFVRYGNEEGPRSRLYVVHVVHGARPRCLLLAALGLSQMASHREIAVFGRYGSLCAKAAP